MGDFARFLVIDLEATCDDRGAVPRAEMEIIEIGAVLVDAASLEPIREFQSFVRPVRHPALTSFCTDLTSITQAEVDAAPEFTQALGALVEATLDEASTLFCSWGDYDRHQFTQDCEYHGVVYPFGAEHFNVKRAFGKRQRMGRGPGMARALRRVGLTLEGTHHRGIDDARNIARLLPFALPV